MGNTGRLPSVAVSRMVHPHVCGEYIGVCLSSYKSHGSSPRVWGIHKSVFKTFHIIWFIPTCVGNTVNYFSVLFISLVHPHVCGEYFFPEFYIYVNGGSSPRVWGIRTLYPVLLYLLWFIPTCVGNTLFIKLVLCYILVHPHVCGEYILEAIYITSYSGSSPRVWGIQRI